MPSTPSRRPIHPPVEGREVWEVWLGFVSLPKPLDIAAAEMKAWGKKYKRKGVYMRPHDGGYLVLGYEENGVLLTEEQVKDLREAMGLESGLLALASGFNGG